MSSELARVRHAFLDAPFTENGWMAALRLFAKATRSSRAQIVGIGDAAALFNVMTDVDPDYQREFMEIGAWRPDVNWRVAASGAVMEVLSERHYDVARAHVASSTYDDHCRKWGGAFGAQTVLVQETGQLVGLAILRDEGEGRTRANDRRIFADGAEHALAAVRMQRAMAHRGVQLLAGTLESLGLAAFLLDRDGRVAALTPQADMLASQRDGDVLRLRGTRLGAIRSDAALQMAIGRALAPEAYPPVHVQQLWLDAARDGAPGMRCDVIRLPRREFAFGFDPRVMVVAHDAADLTNVTLAPLRQALGLTEAEAEIALSLANGMDRDRIAAERTTTAQTLTTQIKSIFRKSDVTREAELVALVNRLMR